MAEPSSFPKIRTDLAYYGVITRVISATQFVAAGLAGLGDGALVGYAAYVLAKANGTTTAPHAEQPAVSAYVSATGTFTHVAYTAPLAVGDQLLLLHPNISTIVATLRTQIDKLAGGETVATHSHQNNVNWQTVVTIDPGGLRRKVHSIWLNFVNLTQNTVWRLSYNFGGLGYEVFNSNAALPWTPAMDNGVLLDVRTVIAHELILEIQSQVLEGAARNIPYEIYWENME